MEKPNPFGENWIFCETIGEGSFGEVKRVIKKDTNEIFAVKIMGFLEKEMKRKIREEIKLHRCLNHENIIGFFGYDMQDDKHYFIMEYASRGALFDQICPAGGVPAFKAQHYFRQLIAGVEYLHERGVCHRNLKPENLLLTEDDVLKISDFSQAAIFRFKGIECKMDLMCGSMGYRAPEILANKPYDAKPVDIWSCGMILVVIYCGELPWEEAERGQAGYRRWFNRGYVYRSPWNRMDDMSLLHLMRKILCESVQNRFTLPMIKMHHWFTQVHKDRWEDSLVLNRNIWASLTA